MGRPISWPTKIVAPTEAIDFYKALAAAAEAGAFADCHVYQGAASKTGVPVLIDPGSKKPLPGSVIVAAYLGQEVTGRRLCASRGCLNPFHYARADQPGALFPGVRPAPELDVDPSVKMHEWIELVEYLMRKHQKKTVTQEWLRQHISEEDVSDEMMPKLYEKLRADWKPQ